MGRTILVTADRDEILSDVAASLIQATAVGSPHKEDAEEYLAAIAAEAVALRALLTSGADALRAARAHRRVEELRCSDLVNNINDEYFNATNRRANDAVREMAFPGGGTSTYLEGRIDDRPAAIELLAMLLERNPHELVPPETMRGWVADLRAAAATLRAAIEEVSPLATADRLRERQLTNLARRGQRQIVRLKRRWVNAGMTQREIHEIIPHRPVKSRKAKSDAASAVPSVPTGEGTSG